MGLREDLTELTPRLRRYARALSTGGALADDNADDIVHATLMRALGARHIGGSSDLLVRLYATVTQIHRDHAMAGIERRAATAGQPALVADSGRSTASRPIAVRQTRLSAGLLSLSLEDREALLLVGLEGFDHDEAARILRISRSALITRLTAARTMLDSFLATRPAVAQRGTVGYLRLVT